MQPTEWIYGIHAVAAVLKKSPHRVLSLAIQSGRFDPAIEALIAIAQTEGLSIQTVSRSKFDHWFPGQTHQGIAANCRTQSAYQEQDIPDFLTRAPCVPLLLILDGVQDPHNLGACLRTADACGVDLVIAPRDASVGLTPTVRKVACGAAETVPFIQVTNLARTLRVLKEKGIWLFGAASEGASHIYQTDFRAPTGFILGSEDKGLRHLTRTHCDALIRIPMQGSVTSLNVSVAASVCLYEAIRQRQTIK